MQTKICSICNEELPLESFNKSARRKDGHRGECKECQKAAALDCKAISHKSYRDRIMDVLNKHGGTIDIHSLRAEFNRTPTAQSGVSSALVNMRDRGEVRITGGGHSNSAKMIELIPEFSVPAGRIVRLSDTKHWNDPPIKSTGTALQSGMPNFALMCG